MPNSAARQAGGAERWTPLAEQQRRALHQEHRSRHPCPRPGLPAPGSQEPRHGCFLLDADRWGKPSLCLALKTQVLKAVLLVAGFGERSSERADVPLPQIPPAAPAPGVPHPEQPSSCGPRGTSSVSFPLWTLMPRPILEPGREGG